MCLSEMNSCVSELPEISVGYVFEPSKADIYRQIIPRRILLGQAVAGVGEEELYGSKSPDDLFGSCAATDQIYFFTRLKKQKSGHTRVQRVAGSGTWHGQKPTDCIFEIDGKPTRIGTMRQFSFKRKAPRKEDDEWVLHEYSVEHFFLNYIRNDPACNNDSSNLNPENIVFCHVYKKVKKDVGSKRKGQDDCCSNKKSKMMDDEYSNVGNDLSNLNAYNVVSSLQEQNNMLETTETVASVAQESETQLEITEDDIDWLNEIDLESNNGSVEQEDVMVSETSTTPSVEEDWKAVNEVTEDDMDWLNEIDLECNNGSVEEDVMVTETSTSVEEDWKAVNEMTEDDINRINEIYFKNNGSAQQDPGTLCDLTEEEREYVAMLLQS